MNAPISPELLRQHDVPGPRYTPYPTAEREQMRELQAQVMVIVDDSGLQATAQGWFFVRRWRCVSIGPRRRTATARAFRGSSE